MLDRLLANAGVAPKQLDGLAFGRGPGSFTGVRIAAGVAQGIALAVDCQVLPVSNLAAIAQRCYRQSGAATVLTAIDARMEEVYWGAYQLDQNGLMQPCIDESVVSPLQVALPRLQEEYTWVGAGTGWDRYQEALLDAVRDIKLADYGHLLPHARDILTLAQTDLNTANGLAPELAQPVYLRDKVARTIEERKAGQHS